MKTHPETWHGIIPGQTTINIAIEILGNPDSRDVKGLYTIIRYVNRDEFEGWKNVELWAETRDQDEIVFAIYRNSPTLGDDFRYLTDVPNVETLAFQYGRPNKVTWAWGFETRFLIWANQGVAAGAEANVRELNWDEMRVGDIVFFEPMGLNQFFRIAPNWPWPDYGGGFANNNLYPPGFSNRPDKLPEDPYDWKNIPREQN
jgi:hypothetical protein